MSALPLIILAVLVLGMLFFAQRNRQKAAAAEVQRRATIGVGTDVMTTSASTARSRRSTRRTTPSCCPSRPVSR